MSIIKDTIEWLSAVDKPVIDKEELKKKVELIKVLVIEELDEFLDALEHIDGKEMRNAIVDAQWIINNLSFYAGFTEEEIEEEAKLVRESNFSKFCKTENEAIESIVAYLKGEHPNKLGESVDCKYYETGNTEYPYVIKRLDGKIMKSINFSEK